MAGNSYGILYRITTFGESHGSGVGVVIDGCPAGLDLDLGHIQLQLNRRKPGQSKIVTQRKEDDEFQVLSGLFENKTTGTPLTFFVPNTNQRPRDYDHVKNTYRPSHADLTYDLKYGHRDYRGGGRSSARETIGRVIAGAVAIQILQKLGVEIISYVQSVGSLSIPKDATLDFSSIEENDVRCPHAETAQAMIDCIKAIKKEGDSIGGTIHTIVRGCPLGLGDPAFDKLPADLAKAMMSINAAKGFEIGSGFKGTKMKGSEHNDVIVHDGDKISTLTNHAGGTLGGISNGMDIYFNTAFKPVATIMKDQQSIDSDGNTVDFQGRGRHDPCVLPRAVPIVEAMTAITLLDHYLRQRVIKLDEALLQ